MLKEFYKFYSLIFSVFFLFSCGIRPTATVAAFGDSITWGYGGLPGGWVEVLEQASGYEISNLGVPGETAAGGVGRIENALSLVPGAKVLIIYHGGNDWISIFRGSDCLSNCEPLSVDSRYVDIGNKLRIMRAKGHDYGKRIVFANHWPDSAEACPNYTAASFTFYQAHRLRLNQEIFKIAAENGDEVVPLAELAELSTDTKYWHDCLHLSRKGYEIAAQKWLDNIAKWEP